VGVKLQTRWLDLWHGVVMDNVETSKAKIWFYANPGIWLDGHGLDPFSEPLTSFRLTSLAILDMLDLPQKINEFTIDTALQSRVRRAIQGAGLLVDENSIGGLVESVSLIYGRYEKAMAVAVEERGGDPRTQSIVQTVGSPERTGQKIEVVSKLSMTIGDDFIDEHLRVPLVEAVVDYLPMGTDPRTAAADLGLNMELLRTPAEILCEAALLSLVSAFEAFLSAVISGLIDLNSNELRELEKTFSYREILDAKNKRELVELIRDQVLAVKKKSFDAMEKYLTSKLGEGASIRSAQEIIQARNVVVHHGGRISEQYVRLCPDTKYQVDDRISISPAYTQNSVRMLSRLALDMVTLCRTSSG